jgi:hypothetical protein
LNRQTRGEVFSVNAGINFFFPSPTANLVGVVKKYERVKPVWVRFISALTFDFSTNQTKTSGLLKEAKSSA